jgi:hypothetical protein
MNIDQLAKLELAGASKFFYLWLYSSLLGLDRFLNFLMFYTVGRTPWPGDQSVARLLPTYTAKQKKNKRIQTSMP